MFWAYLFLAIFLANITGIAIGHFIAERLKMYGKRPVKIMLPIDAGEAISLTELSDRLVVEDTRGDGMAEIFTEPDAEEYEQHELEQRAEWGIIRGLKKVLKSIK